MNGAANCIYAICCPPRSAKQKQALAEEMTKALGKDADHWLKAADWFLENFDLAPVGSLVAFKTEIARLARENP